MGCLKLHSEENNTPMRVVYRNGKRVGTPFPDDIADSVTYNLENQIGSSTLRLSTNGSMIDKEEYYPFGDSSLRTFTKKRYRYCGKEKDEESGLYYYGARYYAAWTCRFISIDPLAHDYPFYTPYNYAGNKPINKIDIDGMQEEGAATKPVNNAKQGTIDLRNGVPKMIKVNATDNQLIELPSNVNIKYSEGGKTIEGFSYSFIDLEGVTRNREFIGKMDIKTNKMLYSSYNSSGIKEMDYYSSWYFKNETDAYNFMWKTTQSKTGWVNTEMSGFITENGVWVSSNAFNYNGESFNVIQPDIKKGHLYIKKQLVLAQIHTHPKLRFVGQGGFSTADMHNATKILNAYQIIMEFNNRVSIGSSPKKGSFFNYEIPSELNKRSLMSGAFELIPFLKKYPTKK